MSPPFLRAPVWSAPLQPCAQTELLERARTGDREAISVLYNRFRDRMIALAYSVLRDRAEAEDAAQEILLRAFGKMPVLHDETEFAAWLYRLALNFCLARKRKLIRRAQLLERDWTPPFEPHFDAQIETRLALERALDELPDAARLTLMLREWHELTYEQIAQITNVPVGTVKSRLSHARREFRRIWEAHNGE